MMIGYCDDRTFEGLEKSCCCCLWKSFNGGKNASHSLKAVTMRIAEVEIYREVLSES